MSQLRGVILRTFLWIFAMVPISILSQSISRHVIATGGQQLIGPKSSLSLTIGQAGLAGTFHQENVVLNVGFQQMEILYSTPILETPNTTKISIYPNPFKYHFYIQLNTETKGTIHFRLFDLQGKLLDHQKLTTNLLQKSRLDIKTPTLFPGVYLVDVTLSQPGQQIVRYSAHLICIK